MNGRIWRQDSDGASNGGAEHFDLCVKGQVHLSITNSWIEVGNGRKVRHWYEAVIEGACDGSCSRTLDLSNEEKKLVEEFLRTNQCGKVERETIEPASGPHHLRDRRP